MGASVVGASGPGTEGQPRQAIVLVHGIGEQRPMATLRAFAGGVFGRPEGQARSEPPVFYSKPDLHALRTSKLKELRRLNVPASRVPDRDECTDGREGEAARLDARADEAAPARPETDIYEYYWAHVMRGTTWGHVVSWVRSLLIRWPPPLGRLRVLWITAWCGVLALAGSAAVLAPPLLDGVPSQPGWLTFSFGLLTTATVASVGLSVVGDAARYLSPTPGNVAVRSEIRSGAIDLIGALCDDQRYRRIIVVGHSLGSVIALDALSWLWQDRHAPPAEKLRLDSSPSEFRPIDGNGDIAAVRKAQWENRNTLETLGIGWAVTDFVTLGSPLAHAPILLAGSPEEFCRLKMQREYPTCPPQDRDERDVGHLTRCIDVAGETITVTLLHHAALFAATRWTNVYFDGDPIAGPVAPHFGPGVLDLEVGRPKPDLPVVRWRCHSRYWDPTAADALDRLLDALDLAATAER